MAYASFDPWQQRLIAEFPGMTDKAIDDAVSEAHNVFSGWRREPPEERCRRLALMSDNLL